MHLRYTYRNSINCNTTICRVLIKAIYYQSVLLIFTLPFKRKSIGMGLCKRKRNAAPNNQDSRFSTSSSLDKYVY